MNLLTRRRMIPLVAALCIVPLTGCKKPNPLIGTWKGTLELGNTLPQVPPGTKLRIEFLFEEGSDGLTGTLKSPDQGNINLTFDTVEVNERNVKLAANGIGASYEGQINASGTTLNGQWKQSVLSLPLTLQKGE